MSPEAIYQVSIATDPQKQITDLSFETRSNAEIAIHKLLIWSRRHLDADNQYLVDRREANEYNLNPAEFQYSDYYTILHNELKSLDKIDYHNHEDAKASDAWIETSRLQVVERIKHLDLLAELPRKEGIWLGVSPPHDWYDHVVKL